MLAHSLILALLFCLYSINAFHSNKLRSPPTQAVSVDWGLFKTVEWDGNLGDTGLSPVILIYVVEVARFSSFKRVKVFGFSYILFFFF